MGIGALLLQTALRSTAAAVEGAAVSGKFAPKSKRRKRSKENCTPCAAMARREQAAQHVASIQKAGSGG